MKHYSDSNERIPDCKTGIQLTLCGYTALCYTVMSEASWFDAIQQSIAIYFTFGIFAGIYILKVSLYFYDLISAKNKNLTKFGAFFRELIATTLFLSAIIFGLFSNTAIGALSPIFFVLSTSVGLLYHLSISIYAGFRSIFAHDPEIKNHYKESCLKHFINFCIFSVGVTLLSLFLLTNIAPLAFGIANAVFNTSCVIYIATMAWKAKRAPKAIAEDRKAENISFFQKSLDDYYASYHREKSLSNHESQKEFLLNEIDKKVKSLEMKYAHSSIFGERKKRSIKIIALHDLKKLILNPFANRHHFEELLKKPMFHTSINNPFQSFFKKKSDTWDIFLAARSYFNHLEPMTAYQL